MSTHLCSLHFLTPQIAFTNSLADYSSFRTLAVAHHTVSNFTLFVLTLLQQRWYWRVTYLLKLLCLNCPQHAFTVHTGLTFFELRSASPVPCYAFTRISFNRINPLSDNLLVTLYTYETLQHSILNPLLLWNELNSTVTAKKTSLCSATTLEPCSPISTIALTQ